MAFDGNLADRIREVLVRKKNIDEMTLFGCIGFLVNGNMLVGVGSRCNETAFLRLMARVVHGAMNR